jgi:hypothetical protein
MRLGCPLRSVIVPLGAALLAGGLAAGCGGGGGGAKVVNNVTLTPATGTTLPPATQSRRYEQRFTVASGGTAPYVFGELSGGLPPGLFLATTDGSGLARSTSDHTDLIGFPTGSGATTVRFRVLDAEGKATDPSYDLVIADAPTPGLTLGPASGTHLADGAIGSTYGPVTLTIGNGTAPYTWQIAYGALPPGLTLVANPSGSNTAEARVAGAPTAKGTWIFEVEVADGSNPARHGGAASQVTVR